MHIQGQGLAGHGMEGGGSASIQTGYTRSGIQAILDFMI